MAEEAKEPAGAPDDGQGAGAGAGEAGRWRWSAAG